jgi:protein-tyrosine phosphatase
VDVAAHSRPRGLLPGFANSADLGGLPMTHGRTIPPRRIVRANTPVRLSDDELTAAHAFGFGAVLDLRSLEELLARPHPLAQLPGYRSVPLIDPEAEAREDVSRFRTLGDIYSSSLRRNATHIVAIFTALAAAPPGPVLVSCSAGRDRTGMVVALLLDLAGADLDVIAAEHARIPGEVSEGVTSRTVSPPHGDDILQMLEHVRATHGSTSGYLRWLGVDDAGIDALRARLER